MLDRSVEGGVVVRGCRAGVVEEGCGARVVQGSGVVRARRGVT